MGVENGMFWSEIGSEFGEPGSTPLPRNLKGGGGRILPFICVAPKGLLFELFWCENESIF